MNKVEWRGHFKNELKSFLASSQFHKVDFDHAVAQNVQRVLNSEAGFCGGYLALASEPNLEELYQSDTNQWVFPKVVTEGLQFFSLKYGRENHALGIQEPVVAGQLPVPIEDCVAVCVPGIGFDRRGRRIGRGKGHYDRALANYKGKKVGVAYSAQICEDMKQQEPWDVQMNFVVTEREILRF